jgi:hypothetical protein
VVGGEELEQMQCWYSIGLLSHLAWAKLDEAEFFASQGQADDGLALIADAVADSEEYTLIKSPALRQRADLLAQSNADASTVDAAHRAAIECAHSQGARYYELQATTSFARWLRSRGALLRGKHCSLKFTAVHRRL